MNLRKIRTFGAASWVCAAAFLCSMILAAHAVESRPAQPAVAEAFPVASDVRVAGDSKQTRFILDLDRKIDVRAFVLGDPYRVVLDIPQVTFDLPAGTGASGRGLIRAFRYGLVMPGGSRVVFDLTGPAKVEKAYVMDAANGQPWRLVVELAAVDRAAFKAAQEGKVAVIGTARPETIAALLEWSVEGRSSTVALAPITALMATK